MVLLDHVKHRLRPSSLGLLGALSRRRRPSVAGLGTELVEEGQLVSVLLPEFIVVEIVVDRSGC